MSLEILFRDLYKDAILKIKKRERSQSPHLHNHHTFVRSASPTRCPTSVENSLICRQQVSHPCHITHRCLQHIFQPSSPLSCVSVFQLCILKIVSWSLVSAPNPHLSEVCRWLLQIVLETMAFTSFVCLPAPSVLIVSRNVVA